MKLVEVWIFYFHSVLRWFCSKQSNDSSRGISWYFHHFTQMNTGWELRDHDWDEVLDFPDIPPEGPFLFGFTTGDDMPSRDPVGRQHHNSRPRLQTSFVLCFDPCSNARYTKIIQDMQVHRIEETADLRLDTDPMLPEAFTIRDFAACGTGVHAHIILQLSSVRSPSRWGLRVLHSVWTIMDLYLQGTRRVFWDHQFWSYRSYRIQ